MAAVLFERFIFSFAAPFEVMAAIFGNFAIALPVEGKGERDNERKRSRESGMYLPGTAVLAGDVMLGAGEGANN